MRRCSRPRKKRFQRWRPRWNGVKVQPMLRRAGYLGASELRSESAKVHQLLASASSNQAVMLSGLRTAVPHSGMCFCRSSSSSILRRRGPDAHAVRDHSTCSTAAKGSGIWANDRARACRSAGPRAQRGAQMAYGVGCGRATRADADRTLPNVVFKRTASTMLYQRLHVAPGGPSLDCAA